MTTKCPKCGSEETTKWNLRTTKKRGKLQRFFCKSCKRTFAVDYGFWKMKNMEQIVAMSVDMYLSNLSSRKMRNQLERHFGIKVSHVTILNWVRKYINKVQGFIQKVKPKLGGRVYADETVINCEDRNDVFWCAVDWDTRFINATLYSTHRQDVKDCSVFLKKIATTVEPQFIQTDSLGIYPTAFKKVFYNRFKQGLTVEHRINNFSKTRKHNVRIETVFSKIKDRVRDFRGFKALWSAPILMNGLILQHNYIEKHSTTGKVPCELAECGLDLSGNRWMDLIRMSSENTNPISCHE